MKALLSFDVKVDKRDSNFESPLEIAERLACNGRVVKGLWESMVEIAELLVEAGAPVLPTEESLDRAGISAGVERNVRFLRILIAVKKWVVLGV